MYFEGIFMKKFCIKCGKEIQNNADFCPFCGSSQGTIDENINTTDTVIADTQNNNNQKLNLAAQPTEAFGKTTDIIPERINQYRKQIGLSGEAPYVYCFFQNSAAFAAFGPLGVLSQKYFALCMEKDGLLTLGLNIKNKFSGKNAFIKFSDITDIKVKNHGFSYFIVINTSEGKLKATVNKMLAHQPWQRENGSILAEELPKINLNN